MSSEKGFTLIELLIVIGILAVLAVTAVLVLNPAEYFKKSRDATRLSDLSTTHRAIAFYQTDGGTSFGASNTVYVSIPDTSATCANLGLPSLPDGWAYACSSTVNYRKADSNGWIPVNLTALSYGAVLNILPIDPINTASTGNYYTYVTGGSWELTSLFESEKYADKAINDGDAYPGIYSIRTSQTSLTPGIRDKGLVGYWKFDEGTETTAYDSSGNSNNGTLVSGPTWTTGQIDGALSFDGENDYVNMGSANNLRINYTGNQITIMAWIYWKGHPSALARIGGFSGYGGDYALWVRQDKLILFEVDGQNGNAKYSTQTINLDQWHHIVGTFNQSAMRIYIDGNQAGEKTSLFYPPTEGTSNLRFGNAENYYFNGTIDDIRIYNRALSASEISAIYNATK